MQALTTTVRSYSVQFGCIVIELPASINTLDQLVEVMSRPTDRLVRFMADLDGDLMIVGASGKVGPSLVRMAHRASADSGRSRRVYAVSRSAVEELDDLDLAHIQADVLDPEQVAALPEAANVIYLVGRKFGATGDESSTWATNVLAAANVARRYAGSRIVAFSTGCVYPVMHIDTAGANEQIQPAPVGEYAMSCLGRERVFDHVSLTAGTPVVHFRLNYAVELRYGVLADIIQSVAAGEPIDLTTGYANVIWQGDVCERALLALAHAGSPPFAVNITGPETFRVRTVAEQAARIFGAEPQFIGEENGFGYLSDATLSNRLFGYPTVPFGTIIEWVTRWVADGGDSLAKPTHFETQDGMY